MQLQAWRDLGCVLRVCYGPVGNSLPSDQVSSRAREGRHSVDTLRRHTRPSNDVAWTDLVTHRVVFILSAVTLTFSVHCLLYAYLVSQLTWMFCNYPRRVYAPRFRSLGLVGGRVNYCILFEQCALHFVAGVSGCLASIFVLNDEHNSMLLRMTGTLA